MTAPGSTPTPAEHWTLQADMLGIANFNPRIESGEDIEDERHDSTIARFDCDFDDEESRANARLVWRAVTEHAALVSEVERLRSVLGAIVARIDGVWDDPALVAQGPLHTNATHDVYEYARAALAQKGEAK